MEGTDRWAGFHTAKIQSLVWSPEDGGAGTSFGGASTWLASGSLDRSVLLWGSDGKLAEAKEVRRLCY